MPTSWELTKKLNAFSVCKKHDDAYMQQTLSRLEADRQFYFNCIRAGLTNTQASILYYLVRMGGWFLWYRRKL